MKSMLVSKFYLIIFTAIIVVLFFLVFKWDAKRYFILGKNPIALYTLFIIYGLGCFIIGVFLDRGQEYEIKLVNQSEVEVKSFLTGKTYICKPEDIYKVLEKDNL